MCIFFYNYMWPRVLKMQQNSLFIRILMYVEAESYLFTSSCMISQTKLRSAIDGSCSPSKNLPFSLSQKDSIFDSDDERSFSCSIAACGFVGRPRTGPRTVLKTYLAEKLPRRREKKGGGN